MKHRFAALTAALLLIVTSVLPCWADGTSQDEGRKLRIIFTSDLHDYYIPGKIKEDERIREHGSAARIKWIIDRYKTDNTVLVDSGDFSMGTLLSATFETEGSELRTLGALGYDVVTLGNHEFDFGPEALANMLTAAENSGDRLPQIVQSNMDFSGVLTEEQQLVKDHYDNGTIQNTTVVELPGSGLKIGFFGLSGYDSIECSPVSGQNWVDYKAAAKSAVAQLKESADVIVCLSHSGTDGNGQTGEDIDLANEVDGIDVIISGHSHSLYRNAVIKNDVIIGSCGEFGMYVGVMDLVVNGDEISLSSYKLISCDERIPEDSVILDYVNKFKNSINSTYLAGTGYRMDDEIGYSNFTFDSLSEMYSANYEFPVGDLIADSYRYEAEMCGVDDIDIAIVGLGTIRKSFVKGYITAEDAFEVCSLGQGADGSIGHNLVTGYLTGKEIKLLTELDSSLGAYKAYIRMSYSGIKYRYNTSRILLDRVTTLGIDHGNILELIEDDKVYKICCNMYAVNMLGMLNGMTKGILTIAPKDIDGNVITDYSRFTLKDQDGKDVKEWIALADYISSFPEGSSGVSELPMGYYTGFDRKVAYSQGGKYIFQSPGTITRIAEVMVLVTIILLILIIVLIKKIIVFIGKKSLEHTKKCVQDSLDQQ